MTTIKCKITGKQEDLKMVLTCGIRNYSYKVIGCDYLIIEWYCQENNYEKALESCMDDVSIREVELWNCELKNIA